MDLSLESLPWGRLAGPLAAAEDSLARLDERLARSPVGEGWIARTHFAEGCAALWLEGELAHLEDLVLHDAGMDIRAPTHELIRAHAVVRARRRIAAEPADWALSDAGLTALRGGAPGQEEDADDPASDAGPIGEDDSPADDAGSEYAAVDALIARAKRRIDAESAAPRDPLVYEPDWREDERLAAWRAAADEARPAPRLLAGALLWDAWERIEPLQHQPWLGNLLVAAHLRERGKTKAHLLCLNAGLRLVQRERRRAADRTTRLIAWAEAVEAAAETGMREHDRLALARRQLERKLVGRRSTSHLAALIDLVLAQPIANAALIAKELNVSPRTAQNLVVELGLRETTGRGRYRAWSIG